VTTDAKEGLVLDDADIVVGGIRGPSVDAPTGVLSGLGQHGRSPGDAVRADDAVHRR
jgi:hypothetical protein